jgi:hypothetical protein
LSGRLKFIIKNEALAMLKRLNQLLLTVMLVTMACVGFASENTMKDPQAIIETFYRQPNYDDFIYATSKMADKTTRFTLYDFATMVLHNHPDYVKKIVESFGKYSTNEKKVLYLALLASDNASAVNAIKQTYQYKKPRIKYHTAKDIDSVKITALDSLWAAYSATGDKQYMMKILKFINSDDTLLIIGYELLNRQQMCQSLQGISVDLSQCSNTDDLKESLRKAYKNDYKKMLFKAVVIAAAIWSFDSHVKTDDVFAKKYNAVIKAESKLDYWKKINAALGNKGDK